MSRLQSIDHVQLAIPPDGETRARAFFVRALGLQEVPKPATLAARSGCWFQYGSVFVHCTVATDFVPATTAHIAFRVRGLDELATELQAKGYAVGWEDQKPGQRCFTCPDPFGNRLLFLDVND